jgi:hypothetical protein
LSTPNQSVVPANGSAGNHAGSQQLTVSPRAAEPLHRVKTWSRGASADRTTVKWRTLDPVWNEGAARRL